MRALVLISFLFIIHSATPTVDIDKLADHAAHKLHAIKHSLKEKAVEHLHKIVEGLDFEKVKKLDLLHLFKPKHHYAHEFPHHHEHIHHEGHHLHHEGHHLHHEDHHHHLEKHHHHLEHLEHEHHHKEHLEHEHHHKEPLFIDPHQVERIKYYFEKEHHHLE